MKKTIACITFCAFLSGCGEFLLTREVTGVVTVKPESRIGASEGTIEQKVALRLNNVSADGTVREIAGGPGNSVDLECISTRCATLQIGDCVKLICLNDRRAFEPNVIQCKLEKLIECK